MNAETAYVCTESNHLKQWSKWNVKQEFVLGIISLSKPTKPRRTRPSCFASLFKEVREAAPLRNGSQTAVPGLHECCARLPLWKPPSSGVTTVHLFIVLNFAGSDRCTRPSQKGVPLSALCIKISCNFEHCWADLWFESLKWQQCCIKSVCTV